MSSQMMTLSFRPRTLDEMVGQKNLVARIRQHMEKRVPAAWMFIGESGSGKTTTARILATSFQCGHQAVFGNPCEACQRNRAKFDIVEINTAEFSGVSEIEAVISGANYNPKPPSKCRVYIFDEFQMASTAAQNALLKYFEDSPKTTVYIICSTAPNKILRTIRRRCLTYTLANLGVNGVGNLVKRAIKFSGQKREAEPLAEALLEAGVTSPGFVVLAVEKYLAGEDAEKAAQVGLDSSIDTLRICRAVTKGDWETVRHALFAANPEDARAIRQAMAGYMKSMLLGSDVGKMARLTSDGIKELTQLNSFEDGLQLSGTISVLYRLCMHFNGGK